MAAAVMHVIKQRANFHEQLTNDDALELLLAAAETRQQDNSSQRQEAPAAATDATDASSSSCPGAKLLLKLLFKKRFICKKINAVGLLNSVIRTYLIAANIQELYSYFYFRWAIQ